MALSKVQQLNVKDRISKIEYKVPVDTYIQEDVIRQHVSIQKSHAVSIELIKALVGGENNDYYCCQVEDSIQAFDVCRVYLLETLKATKRDILYFEDRKQL